MITQTASIHPLSLPISPPVGPPVSITLPPLPARRLRRRAPEHRRTTHLPPAATATSAAAIQLPPLTTVAHDLRGPLQALALSAELLQESTGTQDTEQTERLASTIQRQVLWLQGLVENLHAGTIMQQGRFAVHPLPTDLREIVTGVQPVVEPLLAHRAQPLHLRLPATLPAVAADGRRIGQALVNLLLNASKYSPPETPIDVTVSARRTGVRVEVADRGPGLPPGGAARLFAPFTRAREAAHSCHEGVGLGLAIVHEIVAAHGGRVGAAARRGGGARFWFDLPA